MQSFNSCIIIIFDSNFLSENKPNGEFEENLVSSLPEKDYSGPKTIPQEPVYSSCPKQDVPAPKVITSQGSRSATLSSMAQSRANMVRNQQMRWFFFLIIKERIQQLPKL